MLVDYETVDTLDEVHNHNLRNVLKQFGNWPTIPQVYHNGDFWEGMISLMSYKCLDNFMNYSRLMDPKTCNSHEGIIIGLEVESSSNGNIIYINHNLCFEHGYARVS